MKVCVVGLGKIGLPLAVHYASRGLRVTGCDIDEAKVERITAGDCPISGEEGLEEGLSTAVRAESLRATTDTAGASAEGDVVVIIVPVGLTDDRRPDFTHLDAAVEEIGRGARDGTLVIVESTVPVGTTRERVGGVLSNSGLDVLLAASPERVSSGRIFRDLRTYPKVIGALDEPSWERAEGFYRIALEAPLVRVRDPETAEFAKLAESVYRDANIALANELAIAADTLGVDATEAFSAANTQPYSNLHQPGVGVGGHCMPVYPYFVPTGVTLSQAARAINDEMASYAVRRLEGALGSLQGAAVLILGLAYRANVKEAAHSSAVLLVEALRAAGARALVHDPLYSDAEVRALGLEPPEAFPPADVDAIIVQAWHDGYRETDWRSFGGCRVVLDGRNVLDRAEVEAAGIRYLGIGRS